MSPSEDQLRAALRAGEGSTPDPDAIIGRALQVRAQRHQRRVRVASIAAAVVVVSGIGVGLAAAGGGNNQNAASSRNGASSQSAAGNAAGGANDPKGLDQLSTVPGAPATASSPAADGGPHGSVVIPAGISCPEHAVRYSLPGGGGTDQFGAGASLFSGHVTAMAICHYSPVQGGQLLSESTLDEAGASALAAVIDSSPTVGNTLLCLTPLSEVLIPVGSDQKAMRAISVTGECNQAMVTNGTAVRYVSLTQLGAR